jgi:hypothetical protein
LKKFIIGFVALIITIVAIIYFATTEYFFNRYLAPNIKEYNFSYSSAQGSLLSGFEIKDLRYKDSELSSRVDFKFNPIKLLKGTLSINRLHLEDVNKKTLTKIVDDFKPKDSNTTANDSSSDIGLNFEFRDILLTIKPFKIKTLEVYSNRLQIDYLSFNSGKFNLGNSRYYYNTNIADIEFVGNFRDKILYIDTLDLINLDLKKLISLIESLKSASSNQANSSDDTILFLPKMVNLKSANVTLKPFKIDKVSAKDIKLSLLDALFDVKNLTLKSANIDFEYNSNLADALAKFEYKDNLLTLKNSNINIKEPNTISNILASIPKAKEKNSTNFDILSVIPTNKIKIDKFALNLSNFKYKDETLKSLAFKLLALEYNIASQQVQLKESSLDINSTIASIKAEASIDKDIVVKNLTLSSKNGDKLIEMLSFKSDSNSSKSSVKLPKRVLLKDANIKLKRLSFLPYIIEDGTIDMKNIDINIDKFGINSGKLEIKSNSNWGLATLKGDIKDSNFYASGVCVPNKRLFKQYSIPLNAKNLKPLKVKGRFGFDSLELNTTLVGKDIITTTKGIDIIESKNSVSYNYKNDNTIWNIDAIINTPYTQNTKLKNSLKYIDDKLEYSGKLIPLKSKKINKQYMTLFKNLKLDYKGDSSKIDIGFTTDKLKGYLKGNGYKGGILEIKNISRIKLNSVANLGKSFDTVFVDLLTIKAPIDYKKILPLKGDLRLKSNIADIKGSFSYDKFFATNLKVSNPKNALKIKDLNIKKLFPLDIDLKVKEKVEANIKSPFAKSTLKYNIANSALEAKLNSKTMHLFANGSSKRLKVNIDSKNIYNTLKEISSIYKLKDIPNITGAVKVKADIDNFNRVSLEATSKKIVYKDKKSKSVIENILISSKYSQGAILLKRYKFKAKGYSIFANKPTKIAIEGGNIVLNNFWINDLATLNGRYSIKKSSGKFKLAANSFKITSADADATLKLNTKIDINKNRYSIAGIVDIISANIKRNLANKKVSDNEDIIILQREREKKSTNYAKNVKLDIKVSSKNGIVYSQGGTFFKVYPKLKIKKNFNALTKIEGKIKLDKKSYYRFKDKKLKLQRGVITFKGKSSTPYLNIVMRYRGKDYTIYINISGTSARPVIFFSSNPPLTKDEILAYLLFGDSGAAGTHSQQSMLNLIGGTLAKSFFGAIGLKIDHISIKENGFSIGKNITDNVTIFYNQDGEKASVKTRIDITNSIHTDIEVGEESQSADIIFSKEY